MTSDTATHDIVAAAKALAPLIKESQDEMETLRRLSDPVVRGMADAGIFRAYYPRSIGGLEVSPLTFMEVVEEISRTDGSAGWCAMITGGAGIFGGRLHKHVSLELFGQPPDLRIAGTVVPLGEARIADGGFRIGGHFTFASGIDYANWLVCSCKVVDDKGPKMTPEGTPETVMTFVPVEQAVVRDTWTPVGMCATGSHDFDLQDVYVPVERSFRLFDQPDEPGPLFNPRTLLVYGWGPLGACLTGIARGAMDSFIDLVAGSGSNMSPDPLRDRPAVQSAVGQAEAAISSARAYLFDAVGNVWNASCNGETDPSRKIAQARLAIAHSCRESAKAVDLLFEAAGTTAVYRSHPIERFHRDVHVAAKHWGGNASHIDVAGQVFLGLKPAAPGW